MIVVILRKDKSVTIRVFKRKFILYFLCIIFHKFLGYEVEEVNDV